MGAPIHLDPGSQFGLWTVLELAGTGRQGLLFKCKCACDAEHVVSGATLRNGTSTRCRSCAADAKRGKGRHGATGSPEYRAWSHMITRCRPEYERAKDYFDRGICVSIEWTGSRGFEAFLSHIGSRPSTGHSLDRIENDKGYEPGNVRWATRRQQQRNMRSNLVLTIDGKTMCLAEWALESPVKENTIYYRLKRGWTHAGAVFGSLRRGSKGPRP